MIKREPDVQQRYWDRKVKANRQRRVMQFRRLKAGNINQNRGMMRLRVLWRDAERSMAASGVM